jgi:hypothetical protein
MVDTSAIHALIARARLRLRLQAAFDGAMLATVLAFAAALVPVFAVRIGWVDLPTGWMLLGATAAIIPGGALWFALRKVPDQLIAQRIDRASNLADRLGTACAFETELARGPIEAHDPETVAMMEAAVRDAVRAAPRADLVAATPYRMPAEWPAALVAVVLFLIVAGLHLGSHVPEAPLGVAGTVTLDGKPMPDEAAGRGTLVFVTATGARETRVALGDTGPFRYSLDLEAGAYRVDFEPADSCTDGVLHKMPCLAGNVVPALSLDADLDATDNRNKIPAFVLDCTGRSCTLDIDIKTGVGRPAEAVAFEDDDSEYIRDRLQEMRKVAEAEKDQHLLEFANKVEELLTKAERGELTKEKLLEELTKAEDEFKKEDNKLAEALEDLKKTGEELKKDKQTKELGEALEKGDMEKAKTELEKLAEKLENDKLSEKDRQKIAEAMDKAAEKFDQREKKRDQDNQKQVDQKQNQIKKLEKQRDQTKNEQEKEKLSRRIEKEKRDLKKLEKEKQDREQSQAKRNLKELHRNMKQAAEQMKQKQQDQQSRRQASQKMRDMQRNTGKVDQDQRKQASQKKVASQLDDLREAMQRAKQRGNRGPKDMFGKNKRNQDFARRAGGQKGSRQAWKPGQQPGGQKPGQGNQPGGQGKQPGGSEWGDEHDPDMMGDATGKSGDTKDESVQGVQGREGESTRETILAAAQKGFATRSYKKVYQAYKEIVEDVMSSEKVPSGYKYYVKKYFQKIKPHSMD